MTQELTVEQLKPCPFCGDRFIHAELIPDREMWGVHCPNGLCPTAGLWIAIEQTEAEVIAAANTRTAHPAPERVELVELVVRRMYDDWPSRASSQSLAELAGVPVGEVIPYERTLEMGADHSGLRRLAASAVAALLPLTSEREGIVAWLRAGAAGDGTGYDDAEVLREIADAIERGDHLDTPNE